MTIEQRLDRVEASVRRWRAFAVAAGVALAAVVAVGAQRRPANPNQLGTVPRFQVTAIGDNLLVLNNQTNEATLLFKKRVPGKTLPDWPWAADNTFSLVDALQEAGGAEIQPAPGR